MKRVSFDFDKTLTSAEVERYATELVARGIEVWICTSRTEPYLSPSEEYNDDLFEVADRVGIKREHIMFCNGNRKIEFLKRKELILQREIKHKGVYLKQQSPFLLHADDDLIELSYFQQSTIKPVRMFGNPNWKRDCETILAQTL